MRFLPLLFLADLALAAPASIPVQGVMADDAGAPLQGELVVDFSLYDSPDSQESTWTSSQTVSFSEGFFTAYLGDSTPLDLSQFRGSSMWLGIAIDGDSEMELIQLASAPYAGSADHADEADSLEGATLADILDQIPDNTAIESVAQGVCYDEVSELRAVLDSIYLSTGYLPDWSQLAGIPTDLADGDDDTQYSAGSGLLFDPSTNSFAVDATWVLSTANVPGALDGALDSAIAANYPDLFDGDDDTLYAAGEGMILDEVTGEFSVDEQWLLDTTNAPGALDEAIGDTLLANYPDLFDGDDNTTYSAGDGLFLDTSTGIFSVDADFVVNAAQSSGALSPLIADYLATAYDPSFSDLSGVPADLADGDDDTTYSAGTGLLLTGTTFEGDAAWVESLARGVSFDSQEELTAALDAVYLPLSYVPSFDDLSDVPAGLADGDDDTIYTAGAGLALSGTEFSLDYTPDWADLTGVPTGLADGDDDTTYTAGTGLSLTGTQFALDYTPTWAELTGIPADIADGDANTTYTAGAGLALNGTEFSLNYTPSWTDLAGIPADIADGDDDTVLTEAQVDAFVANNGFINASGAVSAVLSADNYIRNTGDTLSGNLSVTGGLTVGGNVTGLTATASSCSWVSDACETEGTLVYLDRMNNLTCPANKFLRDINVNNCGGGRYQMRFYCCSITVQ